MRYLLPVLLAAVSWLYWDARIPGIPLLNWQVEKFLDPVEDPRRILRALFQVRSLHPALPALAKHPHPGVRARVARLAPSIAYFEDYSPWVRLQAALGLALQEPQACRPVLRSALRPHIVFASNSGLLTGITPAGKSVEAGESIGSIGPHLLAAPLPGRILRWYISEGESISPGQRVADVQLPEEVLVNIVEVLGRIGALTDVSDLRILAGSNSPDRLRIAASEALRQIQARGKGSYDD